MSENKPKSDRKWISLLLGATTDLEFVAMGYKRVDILNLTGNHLRAHKRQQEIELSMVTNWEAIYVVYGLHFLIFRLDASTDMPYLGLV